jgi:HD-GYP domain-containing protein (c-di-GMP phosphodiesterase class II)
VLLVALIVPVLSVALTAGRMVMIPPDLHLVVVGLAGMLSGGAAISMSVIAARHNDGHGVWLGMAFSVIATLLVIHALATPGVLVTSNGLVQVAGVLNIPVGGAILAASSLPVFRRPRNVGLLLFIQMAIVGGLTVAGVVAIGFSSLIPAIPEPSSTAANVIFALGAAALAVLAWRTARTFLLTRRVSDLCVTHGVVLLIVAQYAFLHYGMMDGAFWAAHGLEAVGLGLVAVPAALDLRFAVASHPLRGDLRAADLVEHEEAFLGGRVRALLVRLGAKDPSTEGHTRRVATLAVTIGEQLGLAESRLRQLALGGLLHDIGKLSVPDEILNKPGRLSEAEFAEIRRHPGAGRDLLVELGGFSPLVLALVESHHERLDGQGYPNRQAAGDLPLEVRILTVADVFDALTADRVYRDAWPVERALALLEEESGRAFDPVCVAALTAITAAAPAGLPQSDHRPLASPRAPSPAVPV